MSPAGSRCSDSGSLTRAPLSVEPHHAGQPAGQPSREVSGPAAHIEVFSDRVKFGDGRAELLRLIDQLGSVKKAVARSGMSYRNAWGYLLELEKAAGIQLLERRRGSGPTSGTTLTKEGRLFLERYQRFRRGLDRVVLRGFARAFPRAPAKGVAMTVMIMSALTRQS